MRVYDAVLSFRLICLCRSGYLHLYINFRGRVYFNIFINVITAAVLVTAFMIPQRSKAPDLCSFMTLRRQRSNNPKFHVRTSVIGYDPASPGVRPERGGGIHSTLSWRSSGFHHRGAAASLTIAMVPRLRAEICLFWRLLLATFISALQWLC